MKKLILLIFLTITVVAFAQRNIYDLNDLYSEDFDWMTDPPVNIPDMYATKGLLLGNHSQIGGANETVTVPVQSYTMYDVDIDNLKTNATVPNPSYFYSTGKTGSSDRSLAASSIGSSLNGYRNYLIWELKNATSSVFNTFNLKFGVEQWLTGALNIGVYCYFAVGNSRPQVARALGAYSLLNPNVNVSSPDWTMIGSASNQYVTDITGLTTKKQYDGSNFTHKNNRIMSFQNVKMPDVPDGSSVYLLFVYVTEGQTGATGLVGLDDITVSFNAGDSPPFSTTGLKEASISTLPENVENLDLFLLIGQSNMKGRGELPTMQTTDSHILMMHITNNQWYEAQHPLHFSGDPVTLTGGDNAGYGPGLDFAKEILPSDGKTVIGLIPSAMGGSNIGLWQPGSGTTLYDKAVARAKLAMQNADPSKKVRLKGILWLQGESDATEERYAVYPNRLSTLVDNLRTSFNLPDLPFIACTIGSFVGTNPESTSTRVAEINQALLTLPSVKSITACVDARDLAGRMDWNHYNQASQIVIGQRYAQKYNELNGVYSNTNNQSSQTKLIVFAPETKCRIEASGFLPGETVVLRFFSMDGRKKELICTASDVGMISENIEYKDMNSKGCYIVSLIGNFISLSTKIIII